MDHPEFKGFYTIKKEASFEFDVKKSKFIGCAKPARTEDEAVEFISSIREKHSDATHNCYAYYIYNENAQPAGNYSNTVVQRFNDDGEPGGTAGMPILEVIRKNDIRNIVIVVTRYFGGIMLGAGGLVRAYSKAAGGAVNSAGKYKTTFCTEVRITAGYTLLGKLQNMFLNENVEIKSIEYTQDVEITVVVPENRYKILEGKINGAANASVLIQRLDSYFL